MIYTCQTSKILNNFLIACHAGISVCGLEGSRVLPPLAESTPKKGKVNCEVKLWNLCISTSSIGMCL